MVNKPDIDKLVDRYQDQINEQFWHINACLNIWDSRKKMTRQGFPTLETENLERVYESSLVSAVTAWQLFASDWLVAALAHDSSVLQAAIGGAKKYRLDLGSTTIFRQPAPIKKHLSVREVRDLLEKPETGSYVTVNYESHWRKYRKLLGPEFAVKVDSLTQEDYLFIELCTCLRNMSAHRSDEAVSRVRTVLTGGALQQFDQLEQVSLSLDRGISRDRAGHYLAAEESVRRGKAEHAAGVHAGPVAAFV